MGCAILFTQSCGALYPNKREGDLDLEKVKLFLAVFCFTAISVFGQQDADSVVQKVFRTLTLDEAYLPTNVDELLIGHEWEALAYWDTQEKKVEENMYEAVGDIYQFHPTSFVIKLKNPENPKEFLSAITGTYSRSKNRLILKSQTGNYLELLIIFIDENYLVMEIEGMRLFYTQIR